MPPRVVIREDLADVRLSKRTQDRVGDRMEEGVAVRMSDRSPVMVDPDSTEDEWLAGSLWRRGLEAVKVVAMADSGVLEGHDANCTLSRGVNANASGPSVPIGFQRAAPSGCPHDPDFEGALMSSRTLRPLLSRLALPCSMVLLLAAGGCFNQNGGVTGYFAYVSTPMSPKTVVIYDMRSDTPFFVQDVPVGKQLNFRFLSDGGDDPIYSPGRLQWGFSEAGDSASQLENQLTCPPEQACRIQIELRDPEAPESPDSERYRIDMDEGASHLSPEGGRIPESGNQRIYE